MIVAHSTLVKGNRELCPDVLTRVANSFLNLGIQDIAGMAF